MKVNNFLQLMLVHTIFESTSSTYLYTMTVTFNTENLSFTEVSNAIDSSFLNTTHLRRMSGILFPAPPFPPSPPPLPQQCLNDVYCIIPLHEVHRQRLVPFESRHYDAHRVPCSAWYDKRCASAEEFLYAHNCTGIQMCHGCCTLDPPPSNPPNTPFFIISPPPPAFFGRSPPPLILDTSSDIPTYVFITSILSIVLGCILCTGVLVKCDCGLNLKFDLMKRIEQFIPGRITIKPIDSTRPRQESTSMNRSSVKFIEDTLNDLISLLPSALPSISVSDSSAENIPKSRDHIRNRI